MLNLALNHSVLPTNQGKYFASSPDELALVNAAKYFGATFEGRNNSDNSVTLSFRGEPQIYKLLQVIEFNSTRKRMTSIFRRPDGEVLVMVKGADNIIFSLCHDNQ